MMMMIMIKLCHWVCCIWRFEGTVIFLDMGTTCPTTQNHITEFNLWEN